MVQTLSTLGHDKVSPNDCTWLRNRKVSQETMRKKQKHWQLSFEYSKYKLDGNLDFQDDHNIEHLVDGGSSQDNEILLDLVVGVPKCPIS